jgi:hypothetical protein
MSTFISEPGTRLGGRYRLEDRVGDSGGGWSSWKAIDETLARAVAVLTFAPGFPRIQEVLTAARAASRLTDARLAQVFDVEDDWDQAYIVMEWVAGDSLDDLLSDGPLEPARGAEIVAEGAEAIAVAHAAGLAHLCLTPLSLRWTPGGGVKVLGTGIDAALADISADDPAVADTRGLAMLLYAALTQHWPGGDMGSLPPAPLADGRPRAPRQVCAGVPAAIDDVTCQALFQQDRRRGPPLTTPALFAEALFEVIPAPLAPPPAAPAPPPGRTGGFATQGMGYPPQATAAYQPGGYQTSGYSAGGYQDGSYQAGGYQPGPAARDYPEYQDYQSPEGWGTPPGRPPARPRPPRQPRRGGVSRVGIAVIALLVLAAVGAGVYTLTRSGGSGGAGSPGASAHNSAPASAGNAVLTPVGASGYDALGLAHDPGDEVSAQAGQAIDNSPSTAWNTQFYVGNPVFGGLKKGTGLLLDMGKQVSLSSIQITFGPQAGADVQIKIGNNRSISPSGLASLTTIASRQDVGSGTQTFQTSSSAKGRYVVIWFTKLPPQPGSDNNFQAFIYNVAVRGSG